MIVFWALVPLGILYLPKLWEYDLGKNSITVFSWGDILDPGVIKEFEKETGIKVHLSYYSSNEELIVKLKATRGKGYDLIVPSDYAVQILRKEKLLKPLDSSQLTFLSQLNPLLLHHFYDPGLEYSVPFAWEIFGLGIDSTYFQEKTYPSSWGLIFDLPTIDYRIGMLNDPIEAVSLAAFYLYGTPHFLSEEEKKHVRKLLVAQHRFVAVYASFRADYLLATKNCPVVAASSSYIFRTMRKFPFIRFIVPQEGTFISIENLCIPAVSRKSALVYRFMNYLYEKKSIASHFAAYQFLPATTDAYEFLQLPDEMKALLSPKETLLPYHFIREILPEEEICDLWTDVKSFR